MGDGEEVEILAAEDFRQGGGGEEESPAHGGEPALAVGAQGAVGDDTVDMDVLPEILPPGVEHHGDAELAAEPSGIAAELEQGLGGGVEQQAVDERGIALGDGVEFVGQGEYDMPVADVEELCALALDPSGLRERLTLGAVAIPARCVLNRHRAAVVTARLEPTERGGAAAHQSVDDALLLDREPMRVAIGAGALAQDVGDLQRRSGGQRRVGGMGHRSGPGGTRELQQVQWGRGGRGLVLSEVQVAHGGADGAVSETALDDGQRHAGLEQAGRVRAAAIGSIIARMARPGSERAARRWLGERSALDELLGVDFQTGARCMCAKRPVPKHLSRRSTMPWASAPLLHACRRQYPGGTGRCARRSLPSRWQPSPY